MFNKKLKQQIKEKDETIKVLTSQLSIYNDRINELMLENNKLNNTIIQLSNKLKLTDFEQLNKRILELSDKVNLLNNEILLKNDKLSSLNNELVCAKNKLYIQQCGLYELPNDLQYYENELKSIRKKESDMLINNTYYKFTQQWIVDGSTKKGEAIGKLFTKTFILAFNLNFDSLVGKLTITNKENIKKRLTNMYNNYNKNIMDNGLELTQEYLDLKLKELDCRYNVVLKKQQEKEEEKYRKELLKQELLADKQLEKEKEQLEKEVLKLENKQLKGDNSEILDKTIKDLKDKLQVNEYRRTNTKSGWVYIVSNPSLGENVFKIGITRRDSVDSRLAELSGSNIPFVFKPNCIIWSDDCFKLEADLHKEFSKYRVNKLKVHREFFKLPLDQIESVVKEKYCPNAKFNYDIIDEDFIASGYNLGENFIDK